MPLGELPSGMEATPRERGIGDRDPTCQDTFLDAMDTRASFVSLGDAVPVRDRGVAADC